jgi:phage shock protein A
MNKRHLVTIATACCLQIVLAAAVPAGDVETKIDQLNQREKELIEKLEATQQRVKEIETKLEAVRQRKQDILSKQAVRQLGPSPATTPSPAQTR